MKGAFQSETDDMQRLETNHADARINRPRVVRNIYSFEQARKPSCQKTTYSERLADAYPPMAENDSARADYLFLPTKEHTRRTTKNSIRRREITADVRLHPVAIRGSFRGDRGL
jgi:hypothetical protein